MTNWIWALRSLVRLAVLICLAGSVFAGSWFTDLDFCFGPNNSTVLCVPNAGFVPMHTRAGYYAPPIDYVPISSTWTDYLSVPEIRARARTWDLYHCLPDFTLKGDDVDTSYVDVEEATLLPGVDLILQDHDYFTSKHRIVFNPTIYKLKAYSSANGIYSSKAWWDGSAHKPEPTCSLTFPPPPDDD